MKIFKFYTFLLMAAWLLNTNTANAKKICRRQNKCQVTLPASMLLVPDSINADDAVYYDTSTALVAIVSQRRGNYRSVSQYINCAQKNLEQLLRTSYEDSTLLLLDCRKADFSSGKSATILHFYIPGQTNKLNSYMVYFMHYKKRDIQVSFTYKKENEQKDIAMIDHIMGTLMINK